MPDPVTQEFLKRLEIMLSVSGVPDAIAAFKDIVRYEKLVLKGVSDLITRYKGLDNAVKVLVDDYKKRYSISIGGLKEEKKAVESITKSYRFMGVTLNRSLYIAQSLTKSAIKLTLDYNKNILRTAVAVSRWGISLTSLEKSIKKIGIETSLTRKETLQLFNQYQKGMAYVFVGEFAKLTKRVQKLVGPNIEAMEEMQGAVIGLSGEMMGLARSIATMTDADKDALYIRISNATAIGKMTEQQFDLNAALIYGLGLSKEEKKRNQEIIARQEAVKKLKKAYEEVALAIGERLLPYFKKLIPILDTFIEKSESWGKVILPILGGLAALKIGKMGVGMLGAAGIGVGAATVGRAGMFGRAGTLATAGKFAIKGGVGAMALGLGSKFLAGESRYQERRGRIKTAGGLQMGAGATGIGAAALTGAVIGSILPGIGTAVGAISGAAIGAFSNWSKLGEGWKKLFTSETKLIQEEKAAAYRRKLAQRKEEEIRKKAEDEERKRQKKAEELAEKRMEQERKFRQRQLIGFVAALSAAVQAAGRARITGMGIRGTITEAAVSRETIRGLEMIEARVDAQKELRKLLATGDKHDIATLLSQKYLTESIREELQQRLKTGQAITDQLLVTKVVNDLTKEILGSEKERTDYVKSMMHPLKYQVDVMSAHAQKAQLLVQLADNYAVSVRASAQMRWEAYDALGKQIKLEEKQLRMDRQRYAQETAQGKKNDVLKKVIIDSENKILQIQIQQAGLVKSMRDQWVSAIQSMSVGAAGFTEIIMDSRKNTAQAMAQLGAVRSMVSGAYARRDRRGQVVEQIGRQSVRMGTTGTMVPSRGGIGGVWGMAYETPVETSLGVTQRGGGYRFLMTGTQKERAEEATARMMKRGGQIRGAEGTALALVNPFLRAAVAASNQEFNETIVGGARGKTNITVVLDKTNFNIGLSDPSSFTRTLQEVVKQMIPQITKILAARLSEGNY